MSPDDVAVAAAWTQANNYQFTFAFNGFYADLANDPLTQVVGRQQGGVPLAEPRFRAHLPRLPAGLHDGPLEVRRRRWPRNNVWVTQQAIYNEIHNNIVTGQQLGLSFARTST